MDILYSFLYLPVWVWLISDIITMVASKGTHLRYVAASVETTLRYIAVIVQVSRPFVAPSDDTSTFVFQILNACLTVYIAYSAYKRDDDNWWKGRGTKIKKWAKDNLVISQPQAALNGA